MNFLETLAYKKTNRVPFWFMRQAGRYLPEYRELRKDAGGFLDLLYNPDQASEVTIQPIRRFNMDAAILFSDILVIPQALGQPLKFVTGEGPKLEALKSLEDIQNLNPNIIHDTLNPIYETVRQTRSKLDSEGFTETALIGFAGAPWTVACYMLEGGGSKNGFPETKKWMTENTDSFQILIDILVVSTADYLKKQIEAGVQTIQIFDSWAGLLSASEFQKWVIDPTKKIIDLVRADYPNIPVIGFPRQADKLFTEYTAQLDIQGVGIDYDLDIEWARDNLQPELVVQGNLNPEILLKGGNDLEVQANKILESFSDKPFVFNLGHGIIKETPIEHVEKLCAIIRQY